MRKTMFLTPTHIILKNFEEINNKKEVTFALLENGIALYFGNKAKNPNHYVVEHKDGVIKDTALIKKLYEKKYPEEIHFLKISDYYVQDNTK